MGSKLVSTLASTTAAGIATGATIGSATGSTTGANTGSTASGSLCSKQTGAAGSLTGSAITSGAGADTAGSSTIYTATRATSVDSVAGSATTSGMGSEAGSSAVTTRLWSTYSTTVELTAGAGIDDSSALANTASGAGVATFATTGVSRSRRKWLFTIESTFEVSVFCPKSVISFSRCGLSVPDSEPFFSSACSSQ